MKILFSTLIVSIILSPIYGIGSWLKWQSMKVGTILPCGALTGAYGGSLSIILKGVCFGILFFLFKTFNWWILVSLLVMWFISSWMATLIERKLYAKDHNMDIIIFAAEEYTKDMGRESAAEQLSKVAPKWWIKLMPLNWQRKLRKRLVPILLPGDT